MGQRVGHYVRDARTARRLTQEQVARKTLGVSRATIAAVESGKPIKLETLKLIGRAVALTPPEWVNLVIEWMKDCLGDELLGKISIKPR
jgi:transcriptional regulator with XRE-family HTH domain